MGVFIRKRSLLLKLVLVISIVVFTVEFLIYREDSNSWTAPLQQPQLPPEFEALQLPQRKHLNRVNHRHSEDELVQVVDNEIGADTEEKSYVEKKTYHSKDHKVNNDDREVLQMPNFMDDKAPGEMGKPVVLPKNLTADVKKLVDDGWLKNAFNQYVSDMISVRRSLPDPRDS